MSSRSDVTTDSTDVGVSQGGGRIVQRDTFFNAMASHSGTMAVEEGSNGP